MDVDTLKELAQDKFKLDYYGDHGIMHWERVFANGARLAESEGADIEVLKCFAFLHDCCRVHEVNDPHHGKRASEYITELWEAGLLDIGEGQYQQLCFAVRWHNVRGATSTDITVRCCWDADRLDLVRIEVQPDPQRMYTDTGRAVAEAIKDI